MNTKQEEAAAILRRDFVSLFDDFRRRRVRLQDFIRVGSCPFVVQLDCSGFARIFLIVTTGMRARFASSMSKRFTTAYPHAA